LYLSRTRAWRISLDNYRRHAGGLSIAHEYDGLVKLMDAVATTDLSRPPDSIHLRDAAYQVLLEALVQLSFARHHRSPLDYAQAVGDAYEILKSVKAA